MKGGRESTRVRIVALGLRGMPGVIGGVETHCERLYPELARLATDLRVDVVARSAFVDRRRSFEFNGVRVRPLAAWGRGGGETALHSLFALLYARFALRADIVHFHGIGPAFFTPLARLLGLTAVVTHHAADFQRPKWGRAARWFLRTGERMAARHAHRIICVSDAVRRDLVQRHPVCAPRALVIRHGCSPPSLSRVERDRALAALGLEPGRYILAVGRLEETKRFHDLTAAHAAAPGAPQLVIVGASIGDRAYEQRLRAAAGPDVRFLGYRAGRELDALYAGAGLFVHPSGMEGFGLVVLEAIAAGAPVRLSDIPPHREFGLPPCSYFRPGDVAALAASLRADVVPAEARDGRAIAARHDLGAMVAAHAELFRELAGRPAQRLPSAASS